MIPNQHEVDDAINAAKMSLEKLKTGQAMPSLPIRDLLVLCVEQQRTIEALETRIARLETKSHDIDPYRLIG